MRNSIVRRWVGLIGALLASLSIVAGVATPALAAPDLMTEDLTGPLTPEDLVATLLGGGILVTDVTYTGADVAAGTFSGGTGIVGLESGIILSSGNIANVVGPNTFDNVSTSNGQPGDADLDVLAGGDTLDAAVLEFDFIAQTNNVRFEYVFASDEYNEWVNTAFNDVFGFFVNGTNCATVEGDPVSVNTINNGNPFGTDPRSHPELFINNDLDDGGGAIDTEMDGLTVVLTCEAEVNAGTTNHIKLAIADTSDSILDADVFIGGGTFAAEGFNFYTALSGGAEVTTAGVGPAAVDTDGSGVLGMSVNLAQTQLSFVLITFNLEGIVAAHLHCAPAGENGPVGVTLFAGGPTNKSGILAEGTVTSPDDGNGCGWATVEDVTDAIQDGNVYVNVHTEANPGGEIRGQVNPLTPPDPGSGTFIDDDGSVHEGNIEAIAAPNITRGCNPPDNDMYCPNDDITRGQMAAFLSRALNLPTVAEDFFTDDETSIFEADINAIAAVGITKGCNPPDNDMYCPNDPVQRSEMATFIVRALGLTEGAGDDLFVDDDGNTHEMNIDILATAGITVGCNPPDNDMYCPNDPVVRAQMATFFARFLELSSMTPLAV